MTIVVSGGTVSVDGLYTVRTFEESGTLTVSGGTLTNVECLLIAGGGRASLPDGSYVAGGGAGGVVQNTINLNTGSYSVVVGDPGNNSSFLTMTAIGGGVGGCYANGTQGGSGGGGGVAGTTHINFENFVGGPGLQGFPGGNPFAGGYPGSGPGGGGGAGGSGGAGIDSIGGAGGRGLASAITGNTLYYAAGGSAKGPGGIGPNSPGFYSYGAGGGYSSDPDYQYGSRLNPQSGVLILRYLTP
jgi:hypothetical protein